jgi:hypothetical protein
MVAQTGRVSIVFLYAAAAPPPKKAHPKESPHNFYGKKEEGQPRG